LKKEIIIIGGHYNHQEYNNIDILKNIPKIVISTKIQWNKERLLWIAKYKNTEN